MRLLYFSIVVLCIFLLFEATDASSQCVCWSDGIEAELIENSTGTSCGFEGARIILTSESSPDDFCDNHKFLSADSDGCGTAIGPVDPNPPPGMACGPGAASAGMDLTGVCRQELEEFCVALNAENVPTLSSWALIATAVFIGLVGFAYLRRKKPLSHK